MAKKQKSPDSDSEEPTPLLDLAAAQLVKKHKHQLTTPLHRGW